MSELMDRDAVLDLLAELGRRLDAQGRSAEIYVVGGTAMVLSYGRVRLTRDIDAVWAPNDLLTDIVMEMSRDLGLPSDWLNDRVRPMIPQLVDHGRVEALKFTGLAVAVASPRHMIAMKARAARDARDLDDLALLARHIEVDSASEVLAIADAVWGPDMLREEAVFAVREGLVERGLHP